VSRQRTAHWQIANALSNIGRHHTLSMPMYLNRILLLVLVILYALAPVMADWVSSDATRWYRPQLLWLLVILAVSITMYRDPRDDS
jgi:hypothetical protein